MFSLFSIVILIISVVIHEIAHGYAAFRLGDSTAYREGRLSLNPLVHLDGFGSVILPLLLIFTGSPAVFGYAKPVPYNPYNLNNRRWGELIVALAGPLSNLLIAFLVAVPLRFEMVEGPVQQMFLSYIILINLSLFVFNLVPVPPLDGSKIIYAAFPRSIEIRNFLEKYKWAIFLAFIFFGWKYISFIVFLLFNIIVGTSFVM